MKLRLLVSFILVMLAHRWAWGAPGPPWLQPSPWQSSQASPCAPQGTLEGDPLLGGAALAPTLNDNKQTFQNKYIFILEAATLTYSRMLDAHQTYVLVTTQGGTELNPFARPIVSYEQKNKNPFPLIIGEGFLGIGLSYMTYKKSGWDIRPLLAPCGLSICVNLWNGRQ